MKHGNSIEEKIRLKLGLKLMNDYYKMNINYPPTQLVITN